MSNSQPPKVTKWNPAKVQQELRTAIHAISQQCNTSQRAVLDRYLRLVSPRLAERGEAEFPQPLRRHGANSGRSMYPGVGNLLCFHVGNALMAFYEACLAGEPGEVLEPRLYRLKRIAQSGVAQCRVRGNDQDGYFLAVSEDTAYAVSPEEEPQTPRDADGRGVGGAEGPEGLQVGADSD